jgi:hypothetical protein
MMRCHASSGDDCCCLACCLLACLPAHTQEFYMCNVSLQEMRCLLLTFFGSTLPRYETKPLCNARLLLVPCLLQASALSCVWQLSSLWPPTATCLCREWPQLAAPSWVTPLQQFFESLLCSVSLAPVLCSTLSGQAYAVETPLACVHVYAWFLQVDKFGFYVARTLTVMCRQQ